MYVDLKIFSAPFINCDNKRKSEFDRPRSLSDLDSTLKDRDRGKNTSSPLVLLITLATRLFLLQVSVAEVGN